jgi:DNA/RNA-binding domain of Phe-tRNA-synthetase-like protein
VLLPEELGSGQGTLDLTRPSAVLLDAALHGRLRLGCLVIDGLDLKAEPPGLAEELRGAAEGLHSMWRHVTDLTEIPGVAAGRELFEDLGIDVQRFAPRAEGLLDRALSGRPLQTKGTLASVLALCALRVRVPMAAHDAASLGPQIHVRTGAAGEAYPGTGRNRVVLEGRPALCDQDGPFGSPVGDAQRTKPGPEAERLLIVLYLPSSADPSGLEALLDGVAKTFSEHCGGRETGRLVVG